MNSQNLTRARAYYYEFLAFAFFFYGDDDSRFNIFKNQASYLAQSPLSDENKGDFDLLGGIDFAEFKTEQNAVLFDLSYGNIPLNISFYDEGRDNGAQRLKVIEILKKSKYRRNFKICQESEDFVGFVLALISSFLKDSLNENAQIIKEQNYNSLELANELIIAVLNPFIDELCELLMAHKDAKIFKALANIMNEFMNVERVFLNIKAPPKKATSMAKTAMAMKPFKTKMPSAKSKIHWDEFSLL